MQIRRGIAVLAGCAWLCLAAFAQSPGSSPASPPSGMPQLEEVSPIGTPTTPPPALPPSSMQPMQPASPPVGGDLPENPMTAGLETLSNEQLLNLALAYRAKGDDLNYTRAVATLARVLESDPTNIEANLQMAEILMLRRSYNDGRTYFKKVLTLDGNNYRANYGIGQYYLYTRATRQAILFLKIAANVAPPDKKGEALHTLASAYLQSKELRQAELACEEAIRVDNQNSGLIRTYIVVLVEMEKFVEAREAALRYLALRRRDAQLASFNPEIVREYSAAYDLLIEVLLRLHNSYHKKNARGEVTDQVLPGKEKETAQVLDAIVQARMAQLPIVKVLSLMELLPLSRRATQLDPMTGAYFYTLGMAQYEAGLVNDARDSLLRAAELEPSNPAFRDQAEKLDNLIQEIIRRQQAGQPPLGN
jgi:tetratricopeptide (TPR) repeat protein